MIENSRTFECDGLILKYCNLIHYLCNDGSVDPYHFRLDDQETWKVDLVPYLDEDHNLYNVSLENEELSMIFDGRVKSIYFDYDTHHGFVEVERILFILDGGTKFTPLFERVLSKSELLEDLYCFCFSLRERGEEDLIESLFNEESLKSEDHLESLFSAMKLVDL